MSIEDVIERAGFAAFANALRTSPYGNVLDSGGAYTVFAPTDEAFEKFSTNSMDVLLHGDEALLRAVIGYHFTSGKVTSGHFKGKRLRAVMYAGGDIIIDGMNGLRVNRANLVTPDIIAGPSVIHGIDGVLWPQAPMAAVA